MELYSNMEPHISGIEHPAHMTVVCRTQNRVYYVLTV